MSAISSTADAVNPPYAPGVRRLTADPAPMAVQPDLTPLTDEELVVRARAATPEARRSLLDELYRRHYRRVALWCLRSCGGDEARAADLAQEIFLRAHERLDGFRGDSKFSTWLYTLTRRTAINRGMHEARRRGPSLDDEDAPEIASPEADVSETLERRQITDRLREAIREDLEPLEAEVLYLHHVEGMTLDSITLALGLQNRSGAKAHIVSARRKLTRRFGRWLAAQSRGGRA